MAVYGGLTQGEMVSRVSMTIFDVYNERIAKELIEKWVKEGNVSIDMRLSWSRDDYDVATVAGTYAYTIPTSARHITAVTWDDDVLKHIEYLEWLEAYSKSTGNGTPTNYAIWKGQVFLYPPPSAAQTLTLYIITMPTDIALETDVPDMPVELHGTIVKYALAEAYYHLQDLQAAQIQEQRVEDDLTRFAAETAQHRSGRTHMVDVDVL